MDKVGAAPTQDVAVHLEMFATTHPSSWRKEQLELFPTASWRLTSLLLFHT